MAFVEKSGALDNTTMLSLSLTVFVGCPVRGERTAVTPGYERNIVTECGENLIKKLKRNFKKIKEIEKLKAFVESCQGDKGKIAKVEERIERLKKNLENFAKEEIKFLIRNSLSDYNGVGLYSSSMDRISRDYGGLPRVFRVFQETKKTFYPPNSV